MNQFTKTAARLDAVQLTALRQFNSPTGIHSAATTLRPAIEFQPTATSSVTGCLGPGAYPNQSLGSQGVITNGAVRDIPEVRKIGFHFFASGVQVSHDYAHLEEYNLPVHVFRMTIEPGDLIHADQHGVVTIPADIAAYVADAAHQIEARENRR